MRIYVLYLSRIKCKKSLLGTYIYFWISTFYTLTYIIFTDKNIEPVPQEVLDFEAKVRPGYGDKGKGASLPQTEEDIKEQMKYHSFNKKVSDVISLQRVIKHNFLSLESINLNFFKE